MREDLRRGPRACRRLTLAIKKYPIVVNDGRGFFTTRVFATFISEGLAMLAEGVDPAVIEQAALQAGYRSGRCRWPTS